LSGFLIQEFGNVACVTVIKVACDVEWLPAAGIAPVARVTLLVASLLLGPLALLGI